MHSLVVQEGWTAHETLHILGKTILVRTVSPEIAGRIHYLLRSFSVSSDEHVEPDLTFSITVSADEQTTPTTASASPRYALFRNDRYVGQAPTFRRLFRLLEWQLDIYLAESIHDSCLLHAAALARAGVGVILPGVSGQGKSSTALALLQRGFRYLSDELAVIAPMTGQLHAFPKPLTLKDLSPFPELREDGQPWHGLPIDREPCVDPPGIWYIHPEEIWPGCIENQPVTLRTIIFLERNAKAQPVLKPILANAAMHRLLQNAVNLHRLRSNGLRLLASLVRQADCYVLTSNDIHASAALIEQL